MEQEKDMYQAILDSFKCVVSNPSKRGVKSKPEYFSNLISKMRGHWIKYQAMPKEKRKKMVKGAPKTKQTVSPRNKLRNLISAAENRAREKLKSMSHMATKLVLKKRINQIINLLTKHLSPEEKALV